MQGNVGTSKRIREASRVASPRRSHRISAASYYRAFATGLTQDETGRTQADE